ncbi:MAG TPA: hypothetical protein VH136_05490 [Trebonia sp.]|nr:hypothetical protein [Trebonia sp.]
MPDDFDASDDHGGWEDEDIPDEDDYPQPEPPWPAAGLPPYQDAPPRRWPARYGVTLVLTAVVAAAAGFLAVIAVRDLSARPAAASSVAPASGRAPSAGAPASGGGPAPTTVPGSGQTVQLEIGGKVTAVSATSITVAGPGHQVTAAVTNATKVSGRVSSISGVKAGDEVSLQATATGGKLTATAIQDPAGLP